MTMSSAKTKVLICPYCGDTQPAGERCRVCGGLFEPLSRQASHNAMGPWFIRDERRPFQPGASYETIVKLAERGQVTRYTILRGPTTKQFWTVARRVPGIAHLLGYCHNCDANVTKDDHGCPMCGVPFGAYLDRNYLGLPDVKPLPWEAPIPDDGRSRPMPMPGPTVDFRRAAEPLGLSSFASDDELRGLVQGGVTRPSYTPSATETAHVSTFGHATPQPQSGPMPGAPHHDSSAGATDPTASAAARSMQRRLQQQSQHIRLLMALIGLVSVIAIIAITIMIVRNGRVAPVANSPSPAAGDAKGAASTERDAAKQIPVQPVSTAPVTEEQSSSAESNAEDVESRAIEATGQFKADHDRATALLTEAAKEDRVLKERIADAETAVNLLKNIKAKALPGERPTGLDQEIANAEQLLERLKLQEFFP